MLDLQDALVPLVELASHGLDTLFFQDLGRHPADRDLSPDLVDAALHQSECHRFHYHELHVLFWHPADLRQLLERDHSVVFGQVECKFQERH